MLTKPLTHLRPLLRLPSHSSPTPDHFSSNPSLLHHLPQHPTTSLVSSAQSSAQAASGSANAGASGAGSGRAGWGAGSNSGYTGHARAFLSLQHATSVDPTSGLNHNTDDNQRQKNYLLFKHQLSKRTQLVDSEDTLSSRRQIEAQAGQKLKVVDIDSRSDVRRLESAPNGSSHRRSSIAFPSAPPRVASPTPSRAAPAHLRAIPRSQSSLEIWHVGMTPHQISMRAMSTRSSTISLPDVEEETPIIRREPTQSTRIIGQPNRVLMDLAGLDLPGRPAKLQMVRRNSTATLRQSEDVPELGSPVDERAYEPYEAGEITGESSDTAIDRSFYTALYEANKARDERLGRKLVQHYRSNRDPSAFAPQVQDEELQKYPLPRGYSTPVYNRCLEFLLYFRRSGESIAPILEIYNEMLDRDCVPNGRTYSAVIQALCAREKDVWLAARSWEHEKKWERWSAEKLGIKYDAGAAAEKDQVIEGYKAEGNYGSAIRLFQAATMSQNASAQLKPQSYFSILEAAAVKDITTKDVEAAYDCLKHGVSTRIHGNRPWRAFMFKILAKVNDRDALVREVDFFVEDDTDGESKAHTTYISKYSRNVDYSSEVILERTRLWCQAVYSLLRVGLVDKAVGLWERLEKAEDGAPDGVMMSQRFQYGMELAKADPARGLALLYRMTSSIPREDLGYIRVREYLDLLIENDQAEHFVKFFINKYTTTIDLHVNGLSAPQYLRTIIYLLDIAKRDSTSKSALKVYNKLASIRQIPMDIDLLSMSLPLAAELSDSEHLLHVWAIFEPSTISAAGKSPHGNRLRQMIRDTVASDTKFDFGAVLVFLTRAAEQVDVSQDEAIPVAVARRYLEYAATPRDVSMYYRNWECLVTTILTYPHEDGEMDEALIQIAKDTEAIQASNNFRQDQIADSSYMRRHAARLTSRVGRERAIELLTPAYGQAKAESWAVVEPSQSGVTSLPGPADSSVTSLPATPESGLTISSRLSAHIDRHTARHHPIKPQEAYTALLDALQRERLVAHPDQIARLLDNLSRIGEPNKVRELYALAHHVIANLLPPAEQSAAWYNLENAMLVATCHLGLLEEAGMYRARLVQAGMTPSADAYATMIACSKDTTDDALVARELFEESKSMGVVPNLFLYNTIISKLSKARKAEMALDLFKVMKASGLRPSSVTYGAVINACCRVGDGESAKVLFDEMSSQPDFRPRVPPYNTMMQFHLTTQPSRERVLYYYDALRKNNVPPSAHTYKLLLDAYAVLAPTNLAAMHKVFDGLRNDRHVKVQGTHWASIISAHGIYGNNPGLALDYFSGLPKDRHHAVDLRSEPVVWEAILNVIAQKGTVQQLESLRYRMIESGARATAYVYNVLIAGYARAGEMDKAREVFASMGDSVTGVAAPNNHPQLLTSSGHLKPSTMTDRPTEVVYREPSTYESMIRAELSVDNKEGAEGVLAMMQERRYPVAVFMRAKSLIDDHVPKAVDEPSTPDSSEVGGSADTPATPESGALLTGGESNTFHPREIDPETLQRGIYGGEASSQEGKL